MDGRGTISGMGHREDLLAGAVRCLYEKGYARTTARDIVAASGANLASIGYHYGSKEALMNAALFQAMEEWGTELSGGPPGGLGPAATPLERFEETWTWMIEGYPAQRQVLAATLDVFTQAETVPAVRTVIADGLNEGRLLWAALIHGIDASVDGEKARIVGSVYQALLSGSGALWLIDPDQAPSGHDLAEALRVILEAV
jgi:AcrR family transcriptional regulator